jgi:hypothetical protein
MMKKKKKIAKKPSSRAPRPTKTRTTRKLNPDEARQTKRRARRRPEIEIAPALDVSIPVAHGGTGHLVAETFLERNATSILDIVAPRDVRVQSWCSFARPARGQNKEWVVVASFADENRRYRIPVPRTHFYVWNFGEAPADAEDGERVWRLHGHNVAFSGVGRDICWRVVLRLAPLRVPIAAGTKRRLPSRGSGAKQVTPKPVPIPVSA